MTHIPNRARRLIGKTLPCLSFQSVTRVSKYDKITDRRESKLEYRIFYELCVYATDKESSLILKDALLSGTGGLLHLQQLILSYIVTAVIVYATTFHVVIFYTNIR